MLIVFVIEFCGLSNSDRTRLQLVQLHLVFAVHFIIINEDVISVFLPLDLEFPSENPALNCSILALSIVRV